nr:transposase [Tuberibacillus sp. Marseille-P3662]
MRRPNIIVGMEPTGHYWLNLAYHLKGQAFQVVVVNPMRVKRSKELDDDSPTKNDTKGTKFIAQVVRDGRYHEPTLTEDVYANYGKKAALHLLERGYMPEDIRKTSEEDLLLEVKEAAKRGVGIKRIKALKQAAEDSIGLTVGLRMARQEIRYLIDQYKALEERLIALESQLEAIILHVPGSDQMMAIKGVSAMTVAQ